MNAGQDRFPRTGFQPERHPKKGGPGVLRIFSFHGSDHTPSSSYRAISRLRSAVAEWLLPCRWSIGGPCLPRRHGDSSVRLPSHQPLPSGPRPPSGRPAPPSPTSATSASAARCASLTPRRPFSLAAYPPTPPTEIPRHPLSWSRRTRPSLTSHDPSASFRSKPSQVAPIGTARTRGRPSLLHLTNSAPTGSMRGIFAIRCFDSML